MQIRIAEEYGEYGEPIYTTTLKLKLDELLETDCVKRDAEIDQASAEFEEILGRPVKNGGLESAVIGDAFFNCELVNGLAFKDGEHVGLREAAEVFNSELPPPLKERYTTEWLIDDFRNRL